MRRPARLRRTALVAAVERASGAVVSINVTSTREAPARSPWDFFFVPEGARVVQGYGTGFIIRPNGDHRHQPARGGQRRPGGGDAAGRHRPARPSVLGEDPLTDIAVLRVERQGLPTVTPGRSTDLMIGEWVVALGNPYAYLLGNAEPTVTVGRRERHVAEHPAERRPDRALPRHDPDRRRHQSRQLGRAADQRAGRGGRRQLVDLQQQRRLGRPRLRHPHRARAAGGRRDHQAAARCGAPGSGSRSRARPRCGTGRARAASSWRRWRPDGPAARAGLKAGDVLVEANGRRLRNYLDWEAVKLDLHVGDGVDLNRPERRRHRSPADRDAATCRRSRPRR